MSSKYIPGLNTRPDDFEGPQRPVVKTDDDILVEEFLKRRKNGAMCLHEYCQRNKLELVFRDEAVEYKPGMSSWGRYGCRAIIDEIPYPQGSGDNKKEAKINASSLAFRAVVGLDEFVPEEIPVELDDNRFEEVRVLQDLCTQRGLKYDKLMSVDPTNKHACALHISGHDPIIKKSEVRDDAVLAAHRRALDILGGTHLLSSVALSEPMPPLPSSGAAAAAAMAAVEPPPVTVSGVSRIPNAIIAHEREVATYAHLQLLLSLLPPEVSQFDHHIAAIFLTIEGSMDVVGQIVAFGTGHSSLSSNLLTLDGRCVIDSCALTTARRAFKRYLAQEMLHCYTAKQPSIFQRKPEEATRVCLKPEVGFHLFLSHPPEGDYKESLACPSDITMQQKVEISAGAHHPTFASDLHGALRCRNERGDIQLCSQTLEQSSSGLVKGNKQLWVMSESDKLLRWNILGLQGGAFSIFTDPVYLHSISLGYNPRNDHGHLSRATCCRVYNDLGDELPKPFLINHPALSFSNSPATNRLNIGMDENTQLSFNWNRYDQKVELNEGSSGRSHSESPFRVSKVPMSRQCKAGLHFKWLKDLLSQDGGFRSQNFAGKSPAYVKNAAAVYKQAKVAFLQHCQAAEIGKWIHAPADMSIFTS